MSLLFPVRVWKAQFTRFIINITEAGSVRAQKSLLLLVIHRLRQKVICFVLRNQLIQIIISRRRVRLLRTGQAQSDSLSHHTARYLRKLLARTNIIHIGILYSVSRVSCNPVNTHCSAARAWTSSFIIIALALLLLWRQAS